ncbi:MAG TPA: nickel-dependent hydrogenase large subunit [Candidatus Dormibacteraeota bacterium]|nr:nickel-dependent hydrogenase large subunit [Candidatus Dormibacteraeota bacterium]
MTRIAIDPITRIEGHLRIEVEVANGVVTDAWSSGTMFRGLELILKGRDPRDAWVFAQRACGVCTTVHALASVRAVENALGLSIPTNARLVRNLIAGIQYVQDHVIHFYHLHALDWVDVVSALGADPKATAALAQSISDWPTSSEAYFKGVQAKLKTFVDSGQLGPFANGYWGHAGYKLPAEANLMAVAHYLEALDWQREVIRVQALLGAKNPHPQTYVVGGMALGLDPNSPTALNARAISEIAELFAKAKDFVDRVYIPDVLAVAGFYKDWAAIGKGIGNYMSYGEFPEANGADPRYYLPRGRIMNRDLSKVELVDEKDIAETVAHSYYTYSDGDSAYKNPIDGETKPKYAGPATPFDTLGDAPDKYSWLKSPRYAQQPMEVGPLSRMLVAYVSGNAEVKAGVDGVLGKLGVGPEALFSTLGRVAARAVETQVIAARLGTWLGQFEENLKSGDLAIADVSHWDPSSWPAEAHGFGWEEAPRGSLGHWVRIKDQRIDNYQLVVPSTWNGSPRDAAGKRGAWEEALIGTPVADPNAPVEVLRTVHSFDPCMACAVHVYDPDGGSSVVVRVV